MKIENNDNGFTLSELLVVVAIIAILVAVSIPIFTGKLENARKTTCEHNRTELENVFKIYRMTDENSTNIALLDKAKKIVLEDENADTGCPVKESHYSYEYYDELGKITSAAGKDAVRIKVYCNIKGHGSTTLQQAQMSVERWLATYSGGLSGNALVNEYLKENGNKSYPLSEEDYKEIFGDATINSKYTFEGKQYLRPAGVRINGNLANIQYVSRWDGTYANAYENMRSFAVIVNGKAYVAQNSAGEVIAPMTNGEKNGSYIAQLAAKNYSSVEEFVQELTSRGTFKEAD